MLIRPLAASALICALAACAPHAPPAPASATPAPADTVAPALRAVQQRLVEQDRLAEARLAASMRAVAQVRGRDVTPRGSHVERLLVSVANRGTRDIRGIEGWVRIYRARDARRLGLADFEAKVDVAPGHQTTVPVAIPMLEFAEGAGSLALEAGRPKLLELGLKRVEFEHGGTPGEQD